MDAARVYGPGVTDDTVTVGVAWDPTLEQASADFGLSFKYLNAHRAYGVIAQDINRNGGIGGRELKVLIWEFDRDDYQSMAEYHTAECAHFTEDVEVFAVITPIGDQNSAPCYEAAGVSFIDPVSSVVDRELERTWTHYFNPSSMELTRLGGFTVRGLSQQGFFKSDRQIGVVSFDDEIWRRAVDQGLKPALAAQGLTVSEEAYAVPPRSEEELGTMIQQVSTAVVRFRANGIDDVLIMDTGGILTYQFTTAAEGQQYRGFRYGLTSMNSPSVEQQTGQPAIPAEQLRNAVGVGWNPLVDVPRAVGERFFAPAARRCIELMERDGIRFSKRCCDLNNALARCDVIWFLKAGMEAAKGRNMTFETFRKGVERLGTSFESPRTFAPRFGPDRHQGAYGYRDFAWSDLCGCLEYTSDIKFVE